MSTKYQVWQKISQSRKARCVDCGNPFEEPQKIISICTMDGKHKILSFHPDCYESWKDLIRTS